MTEAMADHEWYRRLEEEDAMVVKALAQVGIHVNSVYDLVNSDRPYPQAISVLIDMLSRVQHDRIKEGVARALAVKAARPVAAIPLIREFRSMPAETKSQQNTKWAIANALSVVAGDTVFGDVSALLSDQRHGWTRSPLALALCNMHANRERIVRQLMELLGDKDKGVANSAMIALGNLRVKEARPKIEAFLRDPDSWVRQKAKQALAKIDKAK